MKFEAEREEQGGLWTHQALLGDSLLRPSLTCSPSSHTLTPGLPSSP